MSNKLILLICILFASCIRQQDYEKKDPRKKSTEAIGDQHQQDSLFKNIATLLDGKIKPDEIGDSIAILIIPIDAACDACRDKAIDSVLEHRSKFKKGHFAIISANGLKTIKAYFTSRNMQDPTDDRIILDHQNVAFKEQLVYIRPTAYYCYDRKAYKRVTSNSITVKEDLQLFFE
ncbi:hypothetical protein [Chitinophaga filiformis]|uniref:AhpC/TSA family protein n=1 Tax=Chitinophaga filiformis TaxID=104663 RepID=A0ABY4I056_CHIFI|nr:hypothetical protein [Chitinophaga filiformis]UPK68071.1 hypothetical protein MYF79_24265 [Chitinophaga filiformis]